MNLFGRKMDCALCEKPFLKRGGKVFMENGKGGVCSTCFEKWRAEGSRCAACHHGVSGTQEVGFFLQQKNLGHYDCGGMRLR